MAANVLGSLLSVPVAASIALSSLVKDEWIDTLDSVAGRSLMVLLVVGACMFEMHLLAILLAVATSIAISRMKKREGFASYPSIPHIDWESKERIWKNGPGKIERPFA
jgi:hypothetical protein